MLSSMKLNDFVNELGSNSPAPGGGSAAALSASLSCALCSMVFNLTVNKKVYREMDEETKSLIDNGLLETSKLKDDFLKEIDRDADEFLKLMNSFKMPKETEDEKKLRSDAINKASEKVLEVPYDLFNEAMKVYGYIENAAKYGNKNAASDAGVSALLLQTAIEGAILNVKINLPSISGEERIAKIKLECEKAIKEGREKRDEILKIVESRI